VLVGIALLCTVAACSGKSGTAPVPPHLSIWPLAAGNQWKWNHTEYDTAGDVISYATSQIDIVKDTMLDDERWFIWSVNGTRVPTTFMGARSDGYYVRDTSGHFELMIKYPVHVNETFPTLGGERIATVESITDTITVPAGTFECCRYRTADTSGAPVFIQWFAPGYGMVKGEDYWSKVPDTGFYLRMLTGLTSYHLK
jgi:hypothetical protein